MVVIVAMTMAYFKHVFFFPIHQYIYNKTKYMRNTTMSCLVLIIDIYWLVVSTPLKNMKVSWDDDIPNIWNFIKFHGSKPPIKFIAKYPIISIRNIILIHNSQDSKCSKPPTRYSLPNIPLYPFGI